MTIGFLIWIIAWALSRLTDAGSCLLLSSRLKKKKGNGILALSNIMFVAIGIDSIILTILLLPIIPYLFLGWTPPPIWLLPWLLCAGTLSTLFKAYTKFRVAAYIIAKGE